ncbi:hypothetical protein EN745_24280 [Mesorhizobium sp. M4A.F.Ca.ET.022.05.2.1]|uniref:hypothetical protein n=1 Tax=Mesorhizobium sp. M4A.F.Ca.ET.022.05.2.1 TaxID=2496653 RepID=UPI000FD4ED3B|nr:hypothetical protein [Mesorhizobium sp. M4A.F.Ca.ET.022.05.2.1]RVC76595.1 hypothetical protein EN745_24280 [Mesorhizobium sp. M4A.F.Ca.ET.022.05.2.1]
MASRFLSNLAVLRAGVKNQKQSTRASRDGRQSLFRKREEQEKKIPHPGEDRIEAAVADPDLRRF